MNLYDDPQRMPRGTYPVALRCLCKRNGRYFSVRCPGVAGHGVWSEQDWHAEAPPYDEQHMVAARAYRDAWMAERAASVAERVNVRETINEEERDE